MAWKKVRASVKPTFTWVEIGLFFLAGIGLVTVFLFFVNAARTKKTAKVPVPIPVVGIPTPTTVVDGFEPKAGYFGHQYYVVAVHREPVQDGKTTFRPLGSCLDFMVVNLTFPIRDRVSLHGKLVKVYGVNGADGVEVHDYKVVIHRPCLSIREPFPPGVHQSWIWDRVWENVSPLLEEYFNPKPKKKK